MPAANKRKRLTVVVMAHQGMGDLLMMVPMLRQINTELGRTDRVFILVKGALEASILSELEWTCGAQFVIIGDGGWKRAARMLYFVFRQFLTRIDYFIAPLLYDRPLNILCVRALRPKVSVARPTSRLKRVITHPVGWRTADLEHQVEFYNRCIVGSGLASRVTHGLTIAPDGNARTAARRLLCPGEAEVLVGFGPGATPRDLKKCWPPEYFGELARMLGLRYPQIRFVLFGGPGDEHLFSTIQRTSELKSDLYVTVIGQQFATVLAAMKLCKCIVAGTTGLGHIAAAADVPVIVPCVPTNPSESAPYTEKAWIITADLPCAPCYRDEFAMCKEFACMTLVRPAAVLQAVEGALAGLPCRPFTRKITTKAIGYNKFE